MAISFVLGTSLLFLSLTAAQKDRVEWHRNNFPNPRIDIKQCGRNNSVSYVCDPQNLLEKVEANQLDNLIESVMDSTKCPCSQTVCDKHARGYKIGIAIIEKMVYDDHDDNKENEKKYSTRKALDESWKFANTLLSRWSLGECDEDLIIFYSKYDQVLYTTIGEVTEKTLKSTTVSEISAGHRLEFDSGHYFEGFRNMINDYRSVLRNEYTRKMAVAQPPKSLAIIASTATYVPASLLMSVVMAVFVALLH